MEYFTRNSLVLAERVERLALVVSFSSGGAFDSLKEREQHTSVEIRPVKCGATPQHSRARWSQWYDVEKNLHPPYTRGIRIPHDHKAEKARVGTLEPGSRSAPTISGERGMAPHAANPARMGVSAGSDG